jgi:2-polyprenyl-3-methyl-5-hydroxy-6-metoxy-1,4-benzoquinol methylase
MGAKLDRTKPRSLLTAIIYRLSRLFINNKIKFRILLDLEWIFERLSTETASAIYGADHVIWKKSSLQYLSKYIKPTDTILDLGCGYGTISYNVSQIARKVVAVDYNNVAIDAAKKKYIRENLQFFYDDALNYLKNTGDKFSVLILTHVLEHIDEPKVFLATYAKHFNNIFIEVPDFDRTFLNHFRQDQNISQIYTDADHVTEFDRDELCSLLSDLNLEIVDAEYRYGVQKYWIRCS